MMMARLRERLLSVIERGSGVAQTVLSEGGPAGLRASRSVAALRLVEGLNAAGIDPRTILDVGANVGQFSKAALGRWPCVRVVAFEPQLTAAEALKKGLPMRQGHLVYPVAVGGEDGETIFYPHRYDRSSSVLPISESARRRFSWAAELAPVRVPVYKLDTLLRTEELVRPIVLKIDVQGYEQEVLRGATSTLSAVDAVVIEQSFEPFYEGQPPYGAIDIELRRAGFRLLRVLDARRDGLVVAESDLLYTPMSVNVWPV